MKRVLCLLACLTLPVVADAQAPVFLPSPLPSTCKVQWDHSGLDVQRWEIKLDGVVILASATPTQSGTTWTVTPCPPMAVGTHSLTVAACNVAGCGTSLPYAFRLVVQPVSPTSVRMGD